LEKFDQRKVRQRMKNILKNRPRRKFSEKTCFSKIFLKKNRILILVAQFTVGGNFNQCLKAKKGTYVKK